MKPKIKSQVITKSEAKSAASKTEIFAEDPSVFAPTGDIKSIGVVAYKGQMDAAMRVLALFAERHPKVKIFVNTLLKKYATLKMKSVSDNFLQKRVDLLLSLGGDGTFLSVARLVGGAGTPILGVNLGRVGFLADVALENLDRILEEILQKDYSIRRRMLLEVTVISGKKKRLVDLALNDVTFTGKMGFQMINLRVTAQGRFLTDYRVDGLLVSTPTGSTAYALSAGGPIIHPAADCLLLTPLNPTSLSVRPLVLPPYQTITVQSAMEKGQEVNMFVDGRNQLHLKPEDVVILRKSKHCLHIARPQNTSYFESLRNKLGWTGSNALRHHAQGT